MAATKEEGPLFLGFDLSTQQLKAVIIDETLKVRHEANVHYDSELPEFRTHGGVVMSKAKIPEMTASPGMWLKALDLLLERLRVGWGPEEMFGRVIGVSGAAQQHGTVYWHKGSANTLANMDSSAFLHTQLASCFSIPQSPTWRDDSTGPQCTKLAAALDGNDNLAMITGSAAHKRFSAAQICKIAETKPQNYANTERISLISSFLCSILIGKHADIDFSDGSGMNLLDLQTKEWHKQCLQSCAPGLGEKLGQPCSPCAIQGKISPYFVDRFGFNPECQVVSFTGDNPSSLAGLGLGPHEFALSLGSSDTIFAWVPEYVTLPGGLGHLLCNPVDPEQYMALLCFANASLTREKVRNRVADKNWEQFNKLLDSTPRGNFGNLGLFLEAAEPLIPNVSPGYHRINAANVDVTHFTSPEIEVRALIEGQALSRRAALETQLGHKTDPDTIITATGGASNNHAILQVYADVFNAPVYVQEGTNSAALGGALRAYHVITHPNEPFTVTAQSLRGEQKPICTPYQDAQQIYDPLLQRWQDLIQQVATNTNNHS